MKGTRYSQKSPIKERPDLRGMACLGDTEAMLGLSQSLAQGNHGAEQKLVDAYSLVGMAATSGLADAKIKFAEATQLLPDARKTEPYDSWKSNNAQNKPDRAYFAGKNADRNYNIDKIRSLESRSRGGDLSAQRVTQELAACLAVPHPYTAFGQAASALMNLPSSSLWARKSGSTAFDPPSGNPAFSKR